jgi:hypothetical protein
MRGHDSIGRKAATAERMKEMTARDGVKRFRRAARSRVGFALVVAAIAATGLSPAGAITSRQPASGTMASATSAPALTSVVSAPGTAAAARPSHPKPQGTRQVQVDIGASLPPLTAHDNRFWAGNDPVTLHGTTTFYGQTEARTFAMIKGWGMNVVRIRMHWTLLEPLPPVKVAGVWIHVYDPVYLQRILNAVNWAHQNGLYAVVVNYPHRLYYFQFPNWMYTHQYNAHGIDYPRTPEGLLQAQTDFWTDDLMLQFMGDMWKWVAGQFAANPGVAGYEILPEPRLGNLPATQQSTQLMLNGMLGMARKVREADPDRVIFFMSRAGKDFCIAHCDLSGWLALGNVALDLHDYFGGRYGSGVTSDPNDPGYDESMQALYASVANPWDLRGSPNYIGNTLSHARFLQFTLDSAAKWGIPVLVGEFGDHTDSDHGTARFLGNVTQAASRVGISWCANIDSIVNKQLDLLPYGWIVLQAV